MYPVGKHCDWDQLSSEGSAGCIITTRLNSWQAFHVTGPEGNQLVTEDDHILLQGSQLLTEDDQEIEVLPIPCQTWFLGWEF